MGVQSVGMIIAINKVQRGFIMDIKEVKKIIENEDKLNPLTDEEIAEKLNGIRENVTMYRKKLKIKSSRGRKNDVIINEIKNIFREKEKISINALTNILKDKGYNISRNVVKKLVDELRGFKGGDDKETDDSFLKLIGSEGSLKQSIMQAKAAILYPPFGLSTLIVGESGVGKSYFAKCMYEFASKNNVIDKDKTFVIFNCADYSDNPQLLLSVLFGYKKGAFTGADRDAVGIVEKADRGILFLDEVHRLPPEGQEILFSILDNGKFRRMGETSFEREVRVLIICATTEDIQSSLLLTFRRRIPMVIDLPSYREKSSSEKIKLIKYFFQKECSRINKKLFVEKNVIDIMAKLNLQGNIGQLKSEIQVLCAKAFMKSINKENQILTVGINDMPQKINETYSYERKADNMVSDCIFIPSSQNKVYINSEGSSVGKNIYSKILEKYNELKVKTKDENEIYDSIFKFISDGVNRFNMDNGDGSLNIVNNNLKSIVRDEVIEAVLGAEKEIKVVYKNRNLNMSVFSYLAIHIEETIKRIENNENMINFNVLEIKNKYRKEYKIAKHLTSYLSKALNLDIPEAEVSFITIYIKTIVENKHLNNKVAIVVISHGHIATEIVKVVKAFIADCSITPIDMPLDKNPNDLYKVALSVSKRVDEGKGILFLVDMGSLIYFAEHIYEDTGIETRTIDRIDLLMVIEAARKSCMNGSNLNDIYYSLVNSRLRFPAIEIKSNEKKLALIAMCLTGEGTAKRIKERLKLMYRSIEIISLGIMDNNLKEKIKEISEKYNLIGVIGTINPEIVGINFIPYNEAMLLNFKRVIDTMLKGERAENSIIREENVIIIEKAKDKKEIMDIMISKLINDGSVKKEYVNSVYAREKDVPTYFKRNVAIPHGHPDYVNKSSIVIAKLDNPVYWGIGKVKIVCLLALKYSDKNLFSRFMKMLSNAEVYKNIVNSKDEKDLYNIVINNLAGDGGNLIE